MRNVGVGITSYEFACLFCSKPRVLLTSDEALSSFPMSIHLNMYSGSPCSNLNRITEISELRVSLISLRATANSRTSQNFILVRSPVRNSISQASLLTHCSRDIKTEFLSHDQIFDITGVYSISAINYLCSGIAQPVQCLCRPQTGNRTSIRDTVKRLFSDSIYTGSRAQAASCTLSEPGFPLVKASVRKTDLSSTSSVEFKNLWN